MAMALGTTDMATTVATSEDSATEVTDTPVLEASTASVRLRLSPRLMLSMATDTVLPTAIAGAYAAPATSAAIAVRGYGTPATIGANIPYGYAASGHYRADSVGAVHIAKREAEAEPKADADAEAFYGYGHGLAYGLGLRTYGGYGLRTYGGYGRSFGHGYGYGRGFGYY